MSMPDGRVSSRCLSSRRRYSKRAFTPWASLSSASPMVTKCCNPRKRKMTRHEPLRSWREATGCPFRMATPDQCHRADVARLLQACCQSCLNILAFLALGKLEELDPNHDK